LFLCLSSPVEVTLTGHRLDSQYHSLSQCDIIPPNLFPFINPGCTLSHFYCQHITLMGKRKDNDDSKANPQLPAKWVCPCTGFRAACSKDPPTQQPVASSSSSHITTLTLGASGHCLKAKHKERSHTPPNPLPSTTVVPDTQEPFQPEGDSADISVERGRVHSS
jgi:hypothetical protein